MSTVEVSKEPGAAGTQRVPALPGSPGEGWLCPSQGRVDSCRAVCLEIEQYSLATERGVSGAQRRGKGSLSLTGATGALRLDTHSMWATGKQRLCLLQRRSTG